MKVSVVTPKFFPLLQFHCSLEVVQAAKVELTLSQIFSLIEILFG